MRVYIGLLSLTTVLLALTAVSLFYNVKVGLFTRSSQSFSDMFEESLKFGNATIEPGDIHIQSNATDPESTESLVEAFLNLDERADYEKIITIQNEINQIKFRKYHEKVFHDSGKGIKVEHWKGVVDAMGKFYKIPLDELEVLKQADTMTETKKVIREMNIGGLEEGKFGYIRIAIDKQDEEMNYILSGTLVTFNLAPSDPEKKSKLDLDFINFEHAEGTEMVLPKEIEKNLKDYFINKALQAAERQYKKTNREL